MKKNIHKNPVHLGLGASVIVEPEFTGIQWYEDYIQRHVNDGDEGRLVSMYTFNQPWDHWEVHPQGSELVLCVAGKMILIQEDLKGKHKKQTLSVGEYVINPPGIWHTADADVPVTALFITSGQNTQHKPR